MRLFVRLLDGSTTVNVAAQVGDGELRAHFDRDVLPGESLFELPYTWWLAVALDTGECWIGEGDAPPAPTDTVP